MKKSKILVPLSGLAVAASAITPLTVLTSCKENNINKGDVIPTDALVIDSNGVLRGFKPGVDVSGYKTLKIPYTVTKVTPYAFVNVQTDSSTIPTSIETIEFEKAPAKEEGGTMIYEPFASCSEIGEYAFYKAPVKYVSLTKGVRAIGKHAFDGSSMEGCYFPVYLNKIDDYAFANTNLYGVTFNNEYEMARGQQWDHQYCAPWQAESYKGIVQESCVNYIGVYAFYNCKNLIYHRLSPMGNIYQLNPEYDGVASSPFAVYNDLLGKPTFSNLKILDYTAHEDWDQSKLPENPIYDFGVEIDTEESDQPYLTNDKFIIAPDFSARIGNLSDGYKRINAIRKGFGMQEVQQGIDTNTGVLLHFGNWGMLPEFRFNYCLDGCENVVWPPATGSAILTGLQQPVFNNMDFVDEKEFVIEMKSFYMLQSGLTQPLTFPEDTIVEFDNIFVDGRESDIKLNATFEKANSKILMHVRVDASAPADLHGKSLAFDMTFKSPRYGFEWAYATKYIHQGSNPEDGNYEKFESYVTVNLN